MLNYEGMHCQHDLRSLVILPQSKQSPTTCLRNQSFSQTIPRRISQDTHTSSRPWSLCCQEQSQLCQTLESVYIFLRRKKRNRTCFTALVESNGPRDACLLVKKNRRIKSFLPMHSKQNNQLTPYIEMLSTFLKPGNHYTWMR